MLNNFLKKLNNDMSNLEKDSCLNYWNAAISGKKEDYDKSAISNIAYDKYFSDKDRFQKLKDFEKDAKNSDLEISRQYTLFYNSFLGNQVDPKKLEDVINLETKIESMFSKFRANVNGENLSDNKIDSILETSNDSDLLKQTWIAHKRIGELVEGDVIELVKKRNEVAKELGFDNYHTMHLTLGEQNPDAVLELFDELDLLTKPIFEEYKNDIDKYLAEHCNISLNELQPWHYQNKFFQEAPNIVSTNFDKYFKGKDLVEVTMNYFDSLGMNINEMVKNSDLFEKPGKNQHAFCEDIDRLGDVRVLCNVVDNSYWMTTLLHEYGHAVYDQYLDFSKGFILRRSVHTFVTEAIAIFFERFPMQSEWLKDVLDIEIGEKEKEEGKYLFNLKQIVFSRWSQVMFRFEKELYANPDQDLNQLWWDLVEKYQGIAYTNRETKADWASKVHIATAPCYYHNYLLGAVLAAQIHNYIVINILGLGEGSNVSLYSKTEVGDFLKKEIFSHGKMYRRDELIEKALGEKLTAKYYARQFK